MTIRNPLSGSGVSRRDMLRIGASGLGLGLYGGLGPVPFVLAQASRASAEATSGKILVVFEWFGGFERLALHVVESAVVKVRRHERIRL